MNIIIILAILGAILSIYSYVVEKKAEKSKEYKSICDINDKVSCTAAFTSSYGKILGIKNSIWGMGFYIFIFLFFINNYLNL
ncbi:MAG: vitamin K epoxide reductase family protein [Nanoarchaeota archaeon]